MKQEKKFKKQEKKDFLNDLKGPYTDQDPKQGSNEQE